MEQMALILIFVCLIVLIVLIKSIRKLNVEDAETNRQIDELKGFEEFYEKLHTCNDDKLTQLLQDARKESTNNKKIAAVLCVTVNIILAMALIVNIPGNIMSGVLSAIIFAVIINILIIAIINMLFNKKKKQYNRIYKEIVIGKIISQFYNEPQYSPEKQMPESEYKKLNYEYYDKYKSEDYFKAKINDKYDVVMAEILTEIRKQSEDANGNATTTTENVFCGLFVKISLDNYVIDELKIMPNGKLLFDNKFNMDSSLFEKYFDVKSSDKIIATQLLTADVMEELVNLQKDLGIIFDIVIKNNDIYLRFHTGSMFESGSLKKDKINKELIQKYYFTIKFTHNLATKLINIIYCAQL